MLLDNSEDSARIALVYYIGDFAYLVKDIALSDGGDYAGESALAFAVVQNSPMLLRLLIVFPRCTAQLEVTYTLSSKDSRIVFAQALTEPLSSSVDLTYVQDFYYLQDRVQGWMQVFRTGAPGLPVYEVAQESQSLFVINSNLLIEFADAALALCSVQRPALVLRANESG